MNWSVPLLIFIGILGRFSLVPHDVLIAVISAYCIVSLTKVLGKDIPILEATSAVYCMQLLVGPAFSYWYPPEFLRYQMAIDSGTYFAYTIPAVCAYLIPIAFARNQLPYLTQVMGFEGTRKVFSAGVFICSIGFLISIFQGSIPLSLRFVAFLIGELKFVGALYCYFCRHGQRRWVLGLVFAATVASSMATAMFHQLILWGVICLSLVIYRDIRRNSLQLRLGCIFAGLVGLIIMQSYKDEYRNAISEMPTAGMLSHIQTTLKIGSVDVDSVQDVIRVRLNQGWIVSNVLKHIPSSEPFAGGETLAEACRDAVLPRLLFTKAARGGGRDNFRRMTGLMISSNTSMGVSPVGEAYANLDVDGGIAVMFVYGVLFSSLYYFLTTRRKLDPLFLLWVPVIFSQALKAETELSVVLNHLIKAGLFSTVMYVTLHQLLFGRLRAPVAVKITQKTNPPRHNI